MIVYAICFDGSRAEVGRFDSLETVTVSPELQEALSDYDLRELCPDIDFTIRGMIEIDREGMRRAYEINDAIIAVAHTLARRAPISVEEAIYAITKLISVTQGSEESPYKLYDEMRAEADFINEHRAESMEPHPVIVIFPALETLRRRTLHDLYGQGVDAGSLAVPSGADPPRR